MLLRLFQTLSGLAIGLLSFDVLAGSSASISYSPVSNSPAPIPSLSPLAMAALAMLLAVVAFRTMKSKGHSNILSMLVGLVLMSAMAWTTNAKFIEDAFAPGGFLLTNPQGGIVYSGVSSAPNPPAYGVTNSTGITQTINSITPPSGVGWSVVNPGASPQCTVGYTLAPSPAICYVKFLFTGPG